MQKGRLFTFGCSLTQYQYPTWADILGKEWEYYENWGKPGSGNLYILNSLIECLHRNKLSKNDHVMIMWTGLSRIDYYQFGNWRMLFNHYPIDSDESPVNCPDGYEIINYPFMYAAHQILNNAGVPYQSMTWSSYFKNSLPGKLYKNTLSNIHEVKFNFNEIKYSPLTTVFFDKRLEHLYATLAGKDWPSLDSIVNGTYCCTDAVIDLEVQDFIKIYKNDKDIQLTLSDNIDSHPRPRQHLEAVDNYFANIKISEDTRLWIESVDKNIVNGNPFKFSANLPKIRL